MVPSLLNPCMATLIWLLHEHCSCSSSRTSHHPKFSCPDEYIGRGGLPVGLRFYLLYFWVFDPRHSIKINMILDLSKTIINNIFECTMYLEVDMIADSSWVCMNLMKEALIGILTRMSCQKWSAKHLKQRSTCSPTSLGKYEILVISINSESRLRIGLKISPCKQPNKVLSLLFTILYKSWYRASLNL